ncbi:hypothetical protein [Arcobacter sp. CECT 9188]|uniref:hypothetical protein n=1 Tax=Arcobacter sp. CECT 9188 TaxID=2044505 RepID=UPI000DE911EF|nr:hypothetical protein [Arcobacter sp. CECT 9188]RBQ27652.1 hypothetical protein CRU88_03005 [Arcobacter sp. CECT 9188]
MKKIVFGTAITLALLLSGCGESTENKAKAEFTNKILDKNIEPIDFKKNIEKIVKEYEKEYSDKANIWLEELKKTDEWKVKEKKHLNSLPVSIDYSNAK